MQMRVFSGIFMAENAPIFSRTLIFTWKKKYFFSFFFRNHVNHVKFFFKKRHVREVSRNPIFGKKVLFFSSRTFYIHVLFQAWKNFFFGLTLGPCVPKNSKNGKILMF